MIKGWAIKVLYFSKIIDKNFFISLIYIKKGIKIGFYAFRSLMDKFILKYFWISLFFESRWCPHRFV